VPALRELQAAMMRSIIDGDDAEAADLIVPKGIDPRRRLAIYSNNSRVVLVDTLMRTFPVVLRLVGGDYFRQCAHAYQRRYPSRSGDLQHVGAHFARYLEELHAGSSYAYLADVARLEWAYQECLIAADHPPLDVAALAHLPPARCGELRIKIHPSLRLISSQYPILRIWQQNRSECDSSASIDLASGAERLALVREQQEIIALHLSAGELAFLQASQMSSTLDQAIAAAEEASHAFRATEALPRFVFAHIIVALS
jgi:hypothetical protein